MSREINDYKGVLQSFPRPHILHRKSGNFPYRNPPLGDL